MKPLCACVVVGAVLSMLGCEAAELVESRESRELSASTGKPFPLFPRAYHGRGVFHDNSDPSNTLIGDYTFNMDVGRNVEKVYYVDREIIALNVYDLDPSDGTDPDREYWIEVDADGDPTSCSLAPFPLPNVFSRDWWLGNNMVFQGQETINGHLADCWQGIIPVLGAEARFCNRADRYPEMAPLLKKVATFEFEDYVGRGIPLHDAPPRLFKLPAVCRGL